MGVGSRSMGDATETQGVVVARPLGTGSPGAGVSVGSRALAIIGRHAPYSIWLARSRWLGSARFSSPGLHTRFRDGAIPRRRQTLGHSKALQRGQSRITHFLLGRPIPTRNLQPATFNTLAPVASQ